MKTVLAIIILAISAGAASAQYRSYGSSENSGYGIGSNSNNHYVAPHVNRSGDFVQGHHRTNPNSTPLGNYGTSPNYNPYTGQTGTRRGKLW